MGRLVIVAYRPKFGRQQALEELLRGHHARLAALGLVSERPPALMRSSDGTLIEVFEWLSAEALADAHDSAEVQRMWAEFGQVCDYVPLRSLDEAGALFAEFEPLSSGPSLRPDLSP